MEEETKEVTIESENEDGDQPQQLNSLKVKTLDGTVYDFEFNNPEVLNTPLIS